MPARNVSLTPHLADFVDENVASGRFQNASEVLREGLRLLEDRQREDELKLDALRRAIAAAIDDDAAGHSITLEPGQIRGFLRSLGRTGTSD